MADFFIRRPIVAIVASIVITLLGLAVLQRLSIEQYPELSPPTIRVETTYQGASAEVVEQSVATPIEQQVNGVDNMIYMKSLNTSDGRMLLDISFQVGMNRDMANVLAQNRVSQAQSRLPQEVMQQGVTVKKINPSILMVVSLYSPKGSRDAQFLNNYAMINMRDALLRVPGIAQVDLYGGAEYGMRVWLRPDRLTRLGLTPADVIDAIKEQNLQAPAGQVGAAPSPPGQEFTYTVKAPGRLVTAEQFENIILRQTAGGGELRLKDVGRAELGSENYKSFGRAIVKDSSGKWLEGAAASLTIYLLPGANQLASAEGIYHTLKESSSFFPSDVAYEIVYDTTPSVEASIESILHTLIEAFILVSLVAFIFFPLLGFSINTLTMFGLVLAIGIVVDDAIVVVEAVMHHIEHGKTPHDATVQAMKEVSGPVVAIALIGSAVFVPVALLGGLTGRLYQQFALTIAVSVLISAFLALSLAPALCAMILKPATPTGGPLGAFYRGFNKVFDVTTTKYVSWSRLFVRRAVMVVVVLLAATGLTGVLGKALPKGFVPEEDMGIFMINAQLPPASSLERTDGVVRQIEAVLKKTDGVVACTGIGGSGILTNSFSPEFASFFCKLEDWDKRKTPALHVTGIQQTLRRSLAAIPGAVIFPFTPPTIPGFGAAGGFNFLLQDRSGTMSVADLGKQTQT